MFNGDLRYLLAPEDAALAHEFLHDLSRKPNLVIAPDGDPYLLRWHLYRTEQASVYFHIQIADDPERPLHDHPWDNSSVILAGGYDELWEPQPWFHHDRAPEWSVQRQLRKGDMTHRLAGEAHRLFLPPGADYSMSLFTTGPKLREWGFWYPEGWRSYMEVTRTEGNKSVHIKQGEV